ncbi:MAG: 1,2-phenylacetyl-CoA epoxidase subunit PaaE [Bacteroidota bacterium]|nr:1,2-phenylacetyl-CoA epoxidase subunit PaaE [Bacteroidota bacterium]
MAKHFRSLIIKDVRKETADCISVAFDIPPEWKEEFRFKAGQNITIRTQMLGEELRRSYSICAGPHENELRIAIKKATGGRFSTYALESLKAGQTLEVMAPTGNFQLNLNETNKKQYIAFAAGSGITPVISLIKTILREETLSRVTLVYGNRTRNDVIFQDVLEDLKNDFPERLQLIHIFSREKADAPIHEGRIDAAKCELLFKYLVPLNADAEFLLCGPSPMIFGVRDWLLQKKVNSSRIHYELFADPGDPQQPSSKTDSPSAGISRQKSHVTLRLDGVSHDFQLPFKGESILDAAIKQGADLPYACKAGVCASCRAKLLEGKVTMDHNYALAEEELEDGFILTCQSHPDSERVVIDYDIR